MPGPAVIHRSFIVLSVLICAIFLLLGALASFRGIRTNRNDVMAQLGIFAILTLTLHAILLFFLERIVHPHFGMPLLIPSAFLCGLGADLIRNRRGGKVIVFLYLTAMAAGLFCFVVQNHRNGGGRALHYGATLSNQLAVVRDIRRETSPSYRGAVLQVHTWNERFFPHALGFLYEFTEKNDGPPHENQKQPGTSIPLILPIDVFYSGPEGTGFIDIQAGKPVPPDSVRDAGP